MNRNKADDVIEDRLQKSGKVAPRLTPDQINNQIKKVTYYNHAHLTICILELENGWFVTGESCPADPANFDYSIGRDISYDNARNKIWALEGYQLRTKLADAEFRQERMQARADQFDRAGFDTLRNMSREMQDIAVAHPFRSR